jgi:replicative DNA helicase
MKEGVHYSKDFEAAVIGICLLEPTAIGRIYGQIGPETFYLEDNQKVYSFISNMYENSIPIDFLTVWQRLLEAGIKFNAGNQAWYLSTLTMHVVSSAHLEYHAYILKKMWRKRELDKLTHSGIDDTKDEKEQAHQINEKINEILSGESTQEWFSMEELMLKLFIHQEQIKSGKKEFLTTGFAAIDRMNGGFSPGQLIVLGARPSVGKSALMNKIAVAVAKQNKQVGIISLEMNNTEIAARLASIQTDTSFGIIYRNLFNDEDQSAIFYNRLKERAVNLPIYVSEKTKVDVNEIKAKAIKLKHLSGMSLLIVDYLQLVESPASKNANREQEVAKISRGLKLLAMDLEIPVIVLCQLNRAITHRKGKDRFPQLSDLRESGAIEQDADVVLMLHRDWMAGYEQNPETDHSSEFEADLLGVKWRNGALFHLELDFQPELMKFNERMGSRLIPVHIPKDDENPF